ncbi:MAG: hypothetical protein WC966_10750 [Bradymonadales bacterium]
MFKCKKCGFFDYELKEKPNGSGTATGLYCKTCGFWHKWIGKDELVRYKAGLYQGKPEPDTTAEIAALKAEIEWLRVLAEKQTPCEINDYIDENYERHMECPICGCGQKLGGGNR